MTGLVCLGRPSHGASTALVPSKPLTSLVATVRPRASAPAGPEPRDQLARSVDGRADSIPIAPTRQRLSPTHLSLTGAASHRAPPAAPLGAAPPTEKCSAFLHSTSSEIRKWPVLGVHRGFCQRCSVPFGPVLRNRRRHLAMVGARHIELGGHRPCRKALGEAQHHLGPLHEPGRQGVRARYLLEVICVERWSELVAFNMFNSLSPPSRRERWLPRCIFRHAPPFVFLHQ